MPKFNVSYSLIVQVRLIHTIQVEADDDELARAIAGVKVRRIKGQPNLFGYVCPNRDPAWRNHHILSNEENPFYDIKSHEVHMVKEVKDV